MNFTMCLSWGIKDQPTLHLATYQTSSDESQLGICAEPPTARSDMSCTVHLIS
ncbi:hypothetical protein SORBI_3009G258900 [Sorghum bicolor]|uniref:Uncharacterized protein n=1 Tax=Sorghum bicolor TaxID=4558 RepID=A0A1B6PAK1_SORBI|nr:hypothetical protein SORBI_3009G258900 [Sorghum bicolor]